MPADPTDIRIQLNEGALPPAPFDEYFLQVLGLIVGAVGVYLIARLVLYLLRRGADKTAWHWDDVLLDRKVQNRMALLAPAIVVFGYARSLPDSTELWIEAMTRGSTAVLIFVAAAALSAVLGAVNTIYESKPEAADRPIAAYIQLAQIVIYLGAGILSVAVLVAKSPLLFVSGLGALTAVLLLIFRDTILSFIASVQLVQSDMIDIGDWIEMPEFHADGNVIDVQLHTVTVQNFDKTITNIPTKELTTNSFRNWREVSRSGLRRIKRSIYIDVSTIRFLTEPEIRRFSDTDLLAKYMRVKLAEVNPGGPAAGVDSISFEGHRRLTNIGTFRAYVSNYLERLDAIDTENSMFLVRQLQPGQHGLPIEVYCFSTATEWSAYEDVQADLFDHLLAVIGEFGLRVFQDPSVEEKGLTVTIPDMAPTHESDLQAHQ